jgi:hypothetical protein
MTMTMGDVRTLRRRCEAEARELRDKPLGAIY